MGVTIQINGQELKPGMKVNHIIFGQCKVRKIDFDYLELRPRKILCGGTRYFAPVGEIRPIQNKTKSGE